MTAPVVVPSKLKTWVGLAGSALAFIVPLVLSVQDYLPPQWAAAIGAVITLLTALGVYKAPYKPENTSIVPNDRITVNDAGPQAVIPPAGGDYVNPWLA
ncbi:holin [Mycobacterium phage Aminay]|uniref:Holin n=1 Tax=Mycobacterium phage Aminay TaxID=2250291 RepID=A0A345KV16_9CAUD|nr:holin [Mycobacterium phage Aminay]AXH46868.1 holin [Mycobacterium phage Aminay]